MIITDEAFERLIYERGRISDLQDRREVWEAAYREQLETTYHQMAPFLPRLDHPWVLDVGCGMAGIDLRLSQHYPHGTFVLMDEAGFAPAKRFLIANGMQHFVHELPPHAVKTHCPLVPIFNLVISTQAWCFHFEPALYLDWIVAHAQPGCVFILDVRRGRPAWLADLAAALGGFQLAAHTGKSDMLVFRR